MSRKKSPPHWQEGRHEFEVTLPADKTKSGKEETVQLALRWKVSGGGRPPTARDRARLAADEARDTLRTMDTSPADEEEFIVRQANLLESALTHACKSWCWSQLRGVDSRIDDWTYRSAFEEKAPDDLWESMVTARSAIWELLDSECSVTEALAAVQTTVDNLLAAAGRPAGNRRRFPVQLRRFRLPRNPRKPRVRPGSWIDTGRYRPAEVLSMMPDPPHIMKLSYGDEIDEDFRPHITDWKSVRKRKRIPSLKDVFSPGDWVRHPRNGFGRVLAVRNSTMDMGFRGRVATFVPDTDLSWWKKIDEPAPEDLRPVGERLPPGTWIKTDSWGEGIVLAVEDEILRVLFHSGAPALIAEPGAGEELPVVWKLDREAHDLQSFWGRRWSWWWLHVDIYDAPVCTCCGYPNFGQMHGSHTYFRARECLICGYPDFGIRFEDEDIRLVLRLIDLWLHRSVCDFRDNEPSAVSAAPSGQEWDESGYSLSEARRNYELTGFMLRLGDSGLGLADTTASLRSSLTRLLDRRMADPSGWDGTDDQAVEKIRQEILDKLAEEESV
ncbi:MAG: hypothetical protein OXS40_15075 [Gammaproteobacteria bacterium]|nr:hypothetical protein [Gammaproteobacteria bacterium]